MIARDSNSYPYLAIAQHFGIDYGEVLKYDILKMIYPWEAWQIAIWRLENKNPQLNEVWNAAIETAAKLAETSKGYPTTVSQNILRLKK